MSSKSSNNNTNNKQKNDYAHKLINDLQQLNTGGDDFIVFGDDLTDNGDDLMVRAGLEAGSESPI